MEYVNTLCKMPLDSQFSAQFCLIAIFILPKVSSLHDVSVPEECEPCRVYDPGERSTFIYKVNISLYHIKINLR